MGRSKRRETAELNPRNQQTRTRARLTMTASGVGLLGEFPYSRNPHILTIFPAFTW
jgi:hypothetical protein